MKKLDKYLIRQFIQTILFGLLTFTLIFIVIDLMENLDDFIDEKVPQGLIFSYYMYFVPEIIRLMIPVAVLLASLFVVGKLSNSNETTIIKSSGISLLRFMTPFLFIAIFISVFTAIFAGWIVPYSNRQRIIMERNYLKRDIYTLGNDLFFQDSKSRIIHVGFFDERNNTITRAGIQFFDEQDITKLKKRFDIERMRYDTLKKEWIAINVINRNFVTDSTESITKIDSLKLNYLNFKPRDLTFKVRKMEEFTLSELLEILDEQKKSGNDVTKLLIDIHTIFSFSFASIIVVLFGVPLAVDKRRGGVAVQFGVNIFITFIYLALQQIIKAFGKNGSLDPFLTAWIPNFLFLTLAILNLFRVKR